MQRTIRGLGDDPASLAVVPFVRRSRVLLMCAVAVFGLCSLTWTAEKGGSFRETETAPHITPARPRAIQGFHSGGTSTTSTTPRTTEDNDEPTGSTSSAASARDNGQADPIDGPSVIVRSPETEHLFDEGDTESDGIVVVSATSGRQSDREDTGAEQDDRTKAAQESYAWWDWSGSINIPDGPNGAWAGINCNTPSSPPNDAYVTRVKVHHEITHTYIGDLEVKVYNQNTGHVWMVRDNEGGSSDNINETRWEYSLFDGDAAKQEWYYRVRDLASADTGTLIVMQLYVYYDVPTDLPDLQAPNWQGKSSSVNEGDPFWVKAKIYNAGLGAAGASHVKLYLSTDDNFNVNDGDEYVGERPVGPLGPGSQEWIQWDFNMPDMGTGCYSVWVLFVVDSRNEVAETSESNPWKSDGVAFTVCDVPPPVLRVDLTSLAFECGGSSMEQDVSEADWLATRSRVNRSDTVAVDGDPARARRADHVVIDDLLTASGPHVPAGPEGGIAIDVSQLGLADLATSEDPILLNNIPLTADVTADFEIVPFEVFAPAARVVEFDGMDAVEIGRPDVSLYRGTGRFAPEDDIFLSVTNSTEVWAIIHSGGDAFYIVPMVTERGQTDHVLVKGSIAPGAGDKVFCSSDLLPENRVALDAFLRAGEPPPIRVGNALVTEALVATLEAEVMVDVAYDLYSNDFGFSSSTATAYATNLFGATSAIYLRDVNVLLTISQLSVWTSPDPFGGSSTSDQLNAYRDYNVANRSGVNRDIAHLLAGVSGFGGIAWVNVLCNNTYGYAVSNIGGNVQFPASGYEWDINVVAHETGHNFGSPHTHCYSPEIDQCYNQQSGCYSGPVVPQQGTTMSYCHLVDSIDMHLHPRVQAVVRSGADSASCVTPPPPSCFMVSNVGGGTLDVTAIGKPSWATLTPAPPYAISAGASQQVCVNVDCGYCPPDFSGTLTISSNGGNATVSLQVDCTDCPNGICESNENACNCSQDCPSVCGDGCCTGSETSANCCQDCGPTCGDGTCNCGETQNNCCTDCGAVCGDGACNCGENSSSCCQDCANCCTNSDCNWPCEECVGGNCQARPACGDNVCNCGETRTSCCNDCAECCTDSDCGPCQECVGGVCRSSCGNNVCEPGCGENCGTCPADCSNCSSNSQCDDGAYCNGAEVCVNACCQPGTPPCPSNTCCDETTNSCIAGSACASDLDCSDGVYCNGAETCTNGCCAPGTPPCSPPCCVESTGTCRPPPCGFTIGGAAYSDCLVPHLSGEPGVEVCLDCPGSGFSTCATTQPPSGGWLIENVPEGVCTVSAHKPGKEVCRVEGTCPPDPCLNPFDIVVDQAHAPENLSIGLFVVPGCLPADMNDDGMCTIVYDVDCFVQCVYFGDCIADPNDSCSAPDGTDLCCPADCNCDGMCTIVYDVDCFVDAVYYGGGCPLCPAQGQVAGTDASQGDQSVLGFTIGGAVFDDENDPLFSGAEDIEVSVVQLDGTLVATTTTAPLGLWRVDDLPEGQYTVVFGQRDRRSLFKRDGIGITVNAENEAANQSIKWARGKGGTPAHPLRIPKK